MKNIWILITTFLKFSWQLFNYVKQIITNIIYIFLIFVVANVFFIYKNEKKITNQYRGALLINLQGTIVDQTSTSNQFRRVTHKIFGLSNNYVQENSLFDIVCAIRHATYDNRITGIVLQLDNLTNSDQSSLQYIGKELNEFKKVGKLIYAIGSSYNQLQYYLASFANSIYMSQYGCVRIYGFSTNKLYYKTLLDKLKINSHIFRVGIYKSAVEPFIRNNISPKASEVDKIWINSLWKNYLLTVAQNRKTTIKNIFPGTNKLIKEMENVNGNSAQYAIKQRLIDNVFTADAIEKELSKKFGWNNKEQRFNYISIYDYINKELQPTQLIKLKQLYKKPENIAVIVTQGIIINGLQEPGTVGSKTIVSQIRKARLNPNIKAIILRVNSPGGSIAAAEAIRNELIAARNADKPIVVSMGNMAASGGYWISTAADYIFASPTTITGSIGVFGIINTFEKSLDTIGVHTDGISTTPLADISETKGINKQFSKIMQIITKNNYYTFLKYVAKARHKSLTEIDKIAQGRIWTGLDALQNGLVDKLGTFDDAVNKAAELAKITTPLLAWMQPKSSFIDNLIFELTSRGRIIMIEILQSLLSQKTINNTYQQTEFFHHMNDPQNCYAICLNCNKTY